LFEIPAKATHELEYTVETFERGSFSAKLIVFIDDGSLRQIELAISGAAQ
jgi:hypothetical protein